MSNMANRTFIVLSDCRFLLYSLRLIDERYFHRKFSSISKGLFYLFWFTPQHLLFSSYIWFALDQNFNLDEIVWILNLCVAIIQIDLIFSCFVRDKNLTAEIMSRLQMIIDQSKFKINFHT